MNAPALRPPTAEIRRNEQRRQPSRTAARVCTEGDGSRYGAASAVRTLQLRETCRLHLLEIVAGMIARPRQRRGRDQQKPFGTSDCGIGVERLGRNELVDLGVARRRLE